MRSKGSDSAPSGAETHADVRMQAVVLFGEGAREALDLTAGERGAERVRASEVQVAVAQLLADLRQREVGVVDALYVQRDVLACEPSRRLGPALDLAHRVGDQAPAALREHRVGVKQPAEGRRWAGEAAQL